MQSFDEVLAAAAREVFPGAELTLEDRLYLRVIEPDGRILQVMCSEPERNSRGMPFRERVRHTADYLTLFKENRGSDSPQWDRLMPLVRPAAFTHQRIGATVTLLHFPLGTHLVQVVGEDHPQITNLVHHRDLGRWEAEPGDLLRAARANIRREGFFTDIMPIGATGQGAAFVVEPYGYQASCLAFPGLFAGPISAIANPVPGPSRPLVFAPSRNEAFIVPEADEAALEAALAYAAEVYTDDPRSMLPVPLVHHDGALVPWQRTDHPLSEQSWRQWRCFVRDQYHSQVLHLTGNEEHARALAEQGLRPIPVAGQGADPTHAVLLPGLDGALVPEVEYLDLHGERERLVVPWRAALEHMALLKDTAYCPTRWRLWHWPDDTWERLRPAQVAPGVLEG